MLMPGPSAPAGGAIKFRCFCTSEPLVRRWGSRATRELCRLSPPTVAICTICKQTLLFGGHKLEGQRYCSRECRKAAAFLPELAKVPEAEAQRRALEIWSGSCPKCGGTGPVELYTTHRCISIVTAAIPLRDSEQSCERCFRSRAYRHLAITLIA